VFFILSVVIAQSRMKLETYKPAPLPETIKPNPIPKTMTDIPPGLSLSGSCLPSMKGLLIPSDVKGMKPSLAISKQIQAIAEADQEIREKGILNEKTNLEDQQRRIKLLPLIPKAVTAQDFANIALVFQHGNCPSLFMLANKMANIAIDLALNGKTSFKYGSIRLLYAETLDRALEYSTPPRAQKYGTQNFALGNDCIRLYVVDPRTTDEERAEYDVAPLKKLIAENKASEKPGCK
jgi:hypothetical protein